jgi:hypothetical protein
MNKKALTEADIRTKFIIPAITGPDSTQKWDIMTQTREEFFFTKGRVVVRGKTVKREQAKKADYLLLYRPNLTRSVERGTSDTTGHQIALVHPSPIFSQALKGRHSRSRRSDLAGFRRSRSKTL